MSTITFDEESLLKQKQCNDPYVNPTYPIVKKEKKIKGKLKIVPTQVPPIYEYIKQYSTQKRIRSCGNETTPYLFWNSENSKYCCGPENMKENDQFVLDKIEDAIRATVENVCKRDDYETYIGFLIKHYIIIYKRQISEDKELSPQDIQDKALDKEIELNRIYMFQEDEVDPSLCDKFPTYFSDFQDRFVDQEVYKAENKASELNEQAKEQRSALDYKKNFEGEGGFYKKSKNRKISRKSRISRKRRY